MADFAARFGALAAPSPYPAFRRSGNIDDRRDQRMTGLEEAQILMRLLNKPAQYPAATMQQPLAGPLSVDAGLLDIVPSHERWLADRIGAQPSSITVSAR